MHAQPRDYKVHPDSETARLIKAAAASAEPIQVDTGEKVYKVNAHEAKKSYDPERMIRAIHAGTDALKGVDADALLQTLREEQTQSSTGRPAEQYAIFLILTSSFSMSRERERLSTCSLCLRSSRVSRFLLAP